MAYNNNGKYPKQKRASYTLGSFFSSDRSTNEYQIVKIGFYDDKLTFNFYKGMIGSNNKMITAFAGIAYETVVGLSSVFSQILRHRVETFRNGKAYADDINLSYDCGFIDSETKAFRCTGHLTVKTVEFNAGDSNRYAVAIGYDNGTDQFNIVLSSNIAEQIKINQNVDGTPITDLDLQDAKLYALTYLISNISRQWPVLVQQDECVRIMMRRFDMICEKLGIDVSGGNGGGGNSNRYVDSGYQSDSSGKSPRIESNANEDDIPF
jgi:hypothetical protein